VKEGVLKKTTNYDRLCGVFDPDYDDLPPAPPEQELQFLFDRLSIRNLKIKITVVVGESNSKLTKSKSCHNPPKRLLSDALDSTVGRTVGKVGMGMKVDRGEHKTVEHNYHVKLKDFNLQAEVCCLRSKINCLADIDTNQIMCQTNAISAHRSLCVSPLGCLPLTILTFCLRDFVFLPLPACLGATNTKHKKEHS
jgi:hypothetical protein